MKKVLIASNNGLVRFVPPPLPKGVSPEAATAPGDPYGLPFNPDGSMRVFFLEKDHEPILFDVAYDMMAFPPPPPPAQGNNNPTEFPPPPDDACHETQS